MLGTQVIIAHASFKEGKLILTMQSPACQLNPILQKLASTAGYGTNDQRGSNDAGELLLTEINSRRQQACSEDVQADLQHQTHVKQRPV